eukprot:m.169330 g.169330  ORF g.169330 m.169330 type:complete len:589 (+) comp38984_c1_seq9:94-1860(+)
MSSSVRKEFGELDIEISSSSILEKLTNIVHLYKIPPLRLANAWFAYSSKRSGINLCLEEIESWEEKEVRRNFTRVGSSSQTKPRVFTKEDIHSVVSPVDEDNVLSSYGASQHSSQKRPWSTPDSHVTKYRHSQSGQTPAPFQSPSLYSTSFSIPSTPFSERTTAGEVCCQLNTQNASSPSWKGSGELADIDLSGQSQAMSNGHKYMFQRLSDKVAVLNDQVEEKEDRFMSKYEIDELDHVDMPRQESVTVVGRICCDSEGKLNSQSILLEGSMRTSGGQSIHLDVTDTKDYSLFSGQIVAVKGINNSSEKSRLVALDLLTSVAEKPPSIKNDVCLSVLVACGPFTTHSNLLYEPLDCLMSLVEKETPDLVILLGPFVDSDHPMIKNCEISTTFENHFTEVLRNHVFARVKKTSTSVLIVPSQRDVHHEYVYPQPAFSMPMKPDNVHLCPDPATVTVNGIVFGLTSTDVLPHIRSNEVVNFSDGRDRLAVLAKHLLHQRHFYPLYPSNESVNLDYHRWAEGASMSVTPHVIILPSNLKTFTKDVEGTLSVNPGRLSKGQGGGTYACLKLTPERGQHSVTDSCIAQVIRI